MLRRRGEDRWRLAPRLDRIACADAAAAAGVRHVAFGVDGVLLVDADAQRVIVVELGSIGAAEAAPQGGSVHWLPVFALGAALGAIAVWFARG